MQQRHLNRRDYFNEQTGSSRNYYLPYIEQFVCITKDSIILEIGCGEGGNLVPFAERGCKVTGIDCAETRIVQAKDFFEVEGLSGDFICANILELKPSKLFDVVIMHDVIEHIDAKELLMTRIGTFLKPSGVLFVGFPAWQMPFGGHQQIARSRIISHFPFIHLLPSIFYKYILRRFQESDTLITELLNIKKTRCSIEVFQKLLVNCNYHIINKRFYFINPHYEIKFNLRPRHLSRLIASIPYLRNFFCSSCFYLVKGSN